MKITLAIPSSQDHVALVGRAVRGMLAEIVKDQEALFLVELAVCEAAANSIEHAYESRPDGLVQVELEIHASEFVIKVRDQGRSLESGRLDNTLLEEVCDSECVQERGRGIPLIHRAMDRVEYYRSGRENTLVMTKILHPEKKTN